MREALKNAIVLGRLPLVAAAGAKWGTRTESNAGTLVDVVEIKRSAVVYFILKMSV
jgi:hypothetical protein